MFKAVISGLSCTLLLGGCVAFQGGMPNLPFNVEEELGIVKSQLKSSASVKTYYDAPSIETRNKFIASRLVITNIEYLKYIKALSAEESQIHSAADILVLSLDIAATAFSPVNTKTVLTALSSVTGGSRLALDNNAFYEKTMSALIAAMNAQRKEVLQRIIKGTVTDLNGYTFEQALSDINDYYLAGTLQGALVSIQRDAGTKEVNADAAIKVFMAARDTKFVDIAVQSRVDKLLGDVDKLADSALFGLIKAPPVTDPFVESVVAARDPQNLRDKDRAAATSILKMRIVLSRRDENSLAAWEAAVKSVAK